MTKVNRAAADERRRRSGWSAGVLVALALTSPAEAGRWSYGGSVAVEGRYFVDLPQFSEQFETLQASGVLEPELRWRSKNRRQQIKIAPFFRLDGADDERTHFDVREAFYRRRGRSVEITVGIGKVFWGVTESRHLVDVVNTADGVEDLDEEDRLGQPMIQFAFQRDWGRLEVLALPGLRERTFPGSEGRLRTPLPVDTDAAEYEAGDDERHLAGAVRWSHVLGDFDLGLHGFAGTARNPQLRPDLENGRLIPYYQRMQQSGLDAQYTKGAWLWKLEALVRGGQGDPFFATVGGFEYTAYQVFGSSADLGFLTEVLYDGRDEDAPFTSFENDTFLGARLALNDIQDTSILAGAIFDHENGEALALVEAERRFGTSITAGVEVRAILNAARDSLRPFRDDSFLQGRLTWNY